MSLIKDDETLRLDAVALAAYGASALCRDLEAAIDDASLRRLVAEHVVRQEALRTRLDDLRRARGELPQAGDPERAHLGAAGAYLRAHLLPGDTTAREIESLLEAAADVVARVRDALALDGLDARVARILAELEEANAAFEANLRGYA